MTPKRAPLRFSQLWAGLTVSQREQRRRALYARVFDTAEGREVLADILVMTGYVSARGPESPEVLAFGEGARWAAGQILQTLSARDDQVARAIVEDNVNEVFDE